MYAGDIIYKMTPLLRSKLYKLNMSGYVYNVVSPLLLLADGEVVLFVLLSYQGL